jgi:hypothetical protein
MNCGASSVRYTAMKIAVGVAMMSASAEDTNVP